MMLPLVAHAETRVIGRLGELKRNMKPDSVMGVTGQPSVAAVSSQPLQPGNRPEQDGRDDGRMDVGQQGLLKSRIYVKSGGVKELFPGERADKARFQTEL